MAAASNLSEVFNQIGQAFHRSTGARVTFSYGSTALLSQQIENSAPFDVFAAADTAHIDALIRKGKLTSESRAIYARGRLALWLPRAQAGAPGIELLATPAVRFISIADPKVAPYGAAAVQTLQSLRLWDKVQDKIVYANNIGMARQHAESGNADAAFTALSLVIGAKGSVIPVNEKLHHPLDQALGILTESRKQNDANAFRRFLLGSGAASILKRYGYSIP